MIVDTLDAGLEIQPYPGLRPFREDETHLYFGREQQRGELLKRLRATRFVAVIGTSGSGKSSLVRAGLLPDLVSGYLPGTGSDWIVVETRPGNDPIGRLTEALATIEWTTDAVALRTSSSHVLDLARERLAPGQHLLVLVDQFEELFRLKTSEDPAEDADEKAAFVRLLLTTGGQRTDVAAAHPGVHVVMAMRSEFLGRASVYRGLPEAIDQGQYLIPRLSREQLRNAIASPARVAAGEVDVDVLQRLLNELGDDQDQLPVLQHALLRCWEFRDAAGHITAASYERSGQLTSALSIDANTALAEARAAVGPRGDHIVMRVFQGLRETDVNGGQTRRPTAVGELCAMADCTVEELTKALAPFRLRSFVLPPPDAALDAMTLVDISHEALLRRWDTLARWIEEDDLDRARYVRLAVRAAEEQDSPQPQYLVPPQLDLLLKFWSDRNPPRAWAVRHHKGFDRAKAFLDESDTQRRAKEADDVRRERDASSQREALAAARAKARRSRRFVMFGGLLVFAGTLVLVNVLEQRQSLRSVLIAAKAETLSDTEADGRLQLAAEAAERTPGPDSWELLLRYLFAAPMPKGWGSDVPQDVVAVGGSPNGRLFYAATGDTVSAVDVDSGKATASAALAELVDGDTGMPGDPVLVPAGDRLLVLWHGAVVVLDGTTLQKIAVVSRKADDVSASLDGRTVAILEERTIVMCDLSTTCAGSQRHAIDSLTQLADVELSDDGRVLVVTGELPGDDNLFRQRQLALFDTVPWNERKVRALDENEAFAMAVDARKVTVCRSDGFRQYDAYDNTLDPAEWREFPLAADGCRMFNGWAVSSHIDGTIRVWDERGVQVALTKSMIGQSQSMRMALTRRTLVTAEDAVTDEGTPASRLRGWGLDQFGRQPLAFAPLGFARGGQVVYGDGMVMELAAKTPSTGPTLTLQGQHPRQVGNGLTLAVYLRDRNEIAIATLRQGAEPRVVWSGQAESETWFPDESEFLISPDERYVALLLAAAGNVRDLSALNRTLRIVDVRAATELDLDLGIPAERVFWGPSSELMVFDGTRLHVVSLPTGARQDGPSLDIDRDESFLLGDTAPGLPTAVAFNEDGTRMALALTVGYKSVVRFFEWPALTAVGPQLGMFGTIAQLSFNAGGGALAAAPATSGTSVHVWNIDSATETLRVPVPGTGIPAVAFTQQGRLAIVSSGALLEVPEDLRTLPAVACGWLARNLDEGEWAYHLKDEVPYEKTCGNLP